MREIPVLAVRTRTRAALSNIDVAQTCLQLAIQDTNVPQNVTPTQAPCKDINRFARIALAHLNSARRWALLAVEAGGGFPDPDGWRDGGQVKGQSEDGAGGDGEQ